ncbi:MAG: aminotransferase class I/II-fold pyridoxal phosphate-dependent enzyme [Acidimicrobiia bacterium]
MTGPKTVTTDLYPAPGVHGGDADAVAAYLGIDPAEVLDLSASLNPEAPDVAGVVARSLDRLGRYPDVTCATSALAESIGVDPQSLVVTNGGAEAIALVAQLHPTGWVEAPEFALYARHLRELDPKAPRWRSNPSNPLGQFAGPDEKAGVWDEAFWALAAGTWTRGDARSWRIGSLTKLWACPGLRAGYAIAPDPASAEAMREIQPRWAVSGLAIAVIELLLPVTDLPSWQRSIAKRRAELADQLRERGLVVSETDACWVLVERPDLRSLLIPTGVLVRDCTSFGLNSTTRIAVPDDQGLERLLNALDRVL